jgi:hypothetical protein
LIPRGHEITKFANSTHAPWLFQHQVGSLKNLRVSIGNGHTTTSTSHTWQVVYVITYIHDVVDIDTAAHYERLEGILFVFYSLLMLDAEFSAAGRHNWTPLFGEDEDFSAATLQQLDAKAVTPVK